MIKPGDIAFFKHCKRDPAQKSELIGFKGHGFGVFLGHVPLMMTPPNEAQILEFMGSLGFISFDAIGQLMGEDALKDLLLKIQQRHADAMKAKAEEIVEKPPIRLLDAMGIQLEDDPERKK